MTRIRTSISKRNVEETNLVGCGSVVWLFICQMQAKRKCKRAAKVLQIKVDARAML